MSIIARVLRRGAKVICNFIDNRRYRALIKPAWPVRPLVSIENFARKPALIVVAHPDDEVIAAGALLGRLPRAGVICVTDGAPRTGSFVRQAGFDNWPEYAQTRRREAAAALALLGREIAPMHNLGIADQEAAYELVALARYLVKPMSSGFSTVVTHAYEGGHPDHDAAAFGVHAACALIERMGRTPPTIVEAALYNAPGGRFVHRQFIPYADAGPIFSFTLTQAERDLKQRMYGCHATQRAVFGSFPVDTESFRLAPRYHFLLPPHPGELGYDQFHWEMTGRRWRRAAMRAIIELELADQLA